MNFLRSLKQISLIPRYNLISILNISCWSCGKTVAEASPKLFCDHCKILQKPDKSRNYFEVIGVNETYDVNPNELTKKYKQLQRYLHPDKFSQRQKEEKIISEEYSSLVNEAYRTLLEPLSRGMYMLQLKGKELSENTENLDKEFLMEIMEKNEEVENAKTDEEILDLYKEIKDMNNTLAKELSKAFKNGDLHAVLQLLSKMKYYTSIYNQIQLAIRKKGIIK